MPTTRKTLMFLSSFFTSFGAFIVVCSMLATQEWVSSRIAISDASSNGSLVIVYGLFRGKSHQEFSHGLEESEKDFGVLEKLNNSSQKTLHLVVILSLVLSLCTSLISSGLTFYNSVSNPYQTFLGPVGVYTWSGFHGLCVSVPLRLGPTHAHTRSRGAMEFKQTWYVPSCVLGPGVYVCKPTAFIKLLGNKSVLNALVEGRLGGTAVERLPLAQGVIPALWDRAPHQAPPL
uniref:Clarin 3 n=1 Tax=Ursus americanus TaxID=9643 RepID=A0A452SBU3_URSAM